MNSYDIETFVDKEKKIIPYCICFIIDKKEYSIYYINEVDIVIESIKTIVNICSKKKQKRIIYVHNLNFDGMLILNSLTNQNEYKFETFIKEMSIYSIKIYNISFFIEFKCSYKILPSSLKKISESFKLPTKLIFPYKFSSINNVNYIGKIPDSFYFNSNDDYKVFAKENESFNFKEYSILYCKRDALITSLFIKVIKKLIQDVGINIENIYSAPSLSLKIFEKKFNKKLVSFDNNKIINLHIRNSYFGGRCEVYGNPKKDEFIYHFDFSGMYSQCMLQKFCYGKYNINTEAKEILKPGFYYIEYYSNNDIPVLPHHRINDGKLVFTNGLNKGIYWYEEVLLFLEKGGEIKKIFYSIEFEKYDYVFEDFVLFFEKIKENGYEYKNFGKLMINSLYGRLGMDEIKNHSFFIKKEELKYYEKNYKVLSHLEINNSCLVNIELDDNIIKKLKIKKKTKNNVALASAITSKARIKLYKAQQSVLENKGRILYSDTDSIFASYKKNVINEKHGEIYWDSNKKDTEIKKAVFINPKTYAVVYKNNVEVVKMKGYNQKNISFIEIEKKFYNDESFYIDDYFSIEKKNFTLSISETKKVFYLNNYNKRIFLNDKKNTKPYLYENFKYL